MHRDRVVALLLIIYVLLLPLLMAEGPFSRNEPLGQGPFAKMSMLYERTFLRVDVMTLEIYFGPDEASQIERLAAGTQLTPALADSIADIALQAQNAEIHVQFKRDFSKNRFVKRARENAERALKAGLIKQLFYKEICDQLPIWYSFMNGRGILEGDEMFHQIKGDTLRSVYRGTDGKILMDQTQFGEQRRLALLGSYLVRNSDFRQGLIESLFAY
ncbi:MAG TPA: hypothetical protein VMY18_05155 [Acidobacteriota bacterium]|nr:hypothetical protein [Acidobacteriota bacterium]